MVASSSLLGRLPDRTPLVGRRDELAFLRAQFAAVAAGGGGRLLFLSGEPGVGKTRLAQELGAYAEEQGGLFLVGHYLRDGTAAYGPWVEALRRGLSSATRDEIAHWAGSYAPDLSQAVPDLVEQLGPLPPPPAFAPEEQRRRLFEGITSLVIGLSRSASGGPLVLLLDDLQWAPGLSLLLHLARRLGESRALILGTYREQEFKEQPALVKDWAELNRSRLATEVPLHLLTEPETAELVAHYFGAGPAALLAGPIYWRTHGNAFFTEEVLRSLAEAGAVRAGADDDEWEVGDPGAVAIPESMRLAVADRVARLGESAHDVLTQAAVLGQEFSFRVLQTLTGQPEDDLLEVVEHAQAARLLVDRSTAGEERFAFWDDQMQEVLYESIPSVRRRRYHLRAGQAIEAVYGGQLEPHLEELSRHFAASHDAAKAAEYALRGAEKNARLFNWPRARQLYERAAEALARLPADDETRRRRVDTLLTLVRASMFTESPQLSLSRLAEVESLLGALSQPAMPGDRQRLARAQYWTGFIYFMQGEPHRAVEYHEQALASARESGDEALALLTSVEIGRVLWVQGYPGRAIPLLAQAVGPLDRPATAWEWLTTVSVLALARAGSGDYWRGMAELQLALDRASASNDPRNVAFCYHYLALLHFLGGDVTRMLEVSRLNERAAEECDEQLWVYLALGRQAWAESRLGQHLAASASLASCRRVQQSLGGRLAMADWYAAVEAEIALNAGSLEKACALAERAVAQAQAVGGLFAEALAQRVWGQALAAIDPARWDEAEGHLTASLRCFEEGEHRLEAARTNVVWGEALRDRGVLTAAREHLEKAAAQFEASGLAEELKRTRLALQDLTSRGTEGPSEEPRGATKANPGGLTEREVEVLRLLVAGRMNKEIATELVVSVATVERHITNIYGKIGARGRAEAVAYALKYGLV